MWQQPYRDAHVRSLLETTGHAHEDHSLIGHVARTPYVFSRHVNTSKLSKNLRACSRAIFLDVV